MNDRQSSHHLHELYIYPRLPAHTYISNKESRIRWCDCSHLLIVLQKMVSFFLFAMMSPGFTSNLVTESNFVIPTLESPRFKRVLDRFLTHVVTWCVFSTWGTPIFPLVVFFWDVFPLVAIYAVLLPLPNWTTPIFPLVIPQFWAETICKFRSQTNRSVRMSN